MKKEDKYIEKYGKMMADQLIIISDKSDPVQEAMKMIEILKGFERDVRKDQDKITRHACASEFNKLHCDLLDKEERHCFEMERVKRIIMNTEAV